MSLLKRLFPRWGYQIINQIYETTFYANHIVVSMYTMIHELFINKDLVELPALFQYIFVIRHMCYKIKFGCKVRRF